MSTKKVQDGHILTLTAPSGGVTTGVGYLIGSLFVVALITAAEAAEFTGDTEGVYTLPKTSAQAWTEGQKIYWDNSNARCDSDGTVGMLIGVAAAVAANPSSAGVVRLNGVAPASSEGPQGAIVDLTDNTGQSGTHDDTLAATTTQADITGGEAPTEAEFNTLLAEVRVICQNVSDVAQKVKEIRTALIAAGVISA